MKKYLFYTPEGITLAPDPEVEIENCQLLGFSIGSNEVDALHNLLKDNNWIQKAGYDVKKVVAVQIVGSDTHNGI